MDAQQQDRLRELIKNEMRAQHMMSVTLARQVGMNRNHVSRLLSGKAGLTYETAAKMASVLGYRLAVSWESMYD